MKKFTSGIGTEVLRVRREGPRKPLRTFKEMAEEFEVSTHVLAALIGSRAGPKPLIKHYCTVKNTWYDPDVLREWWKKVKPTV